MMEKEVDVVYEEDENLGERRDEGTSSLCP